MIDFSQYRPLSFSSCLDSKLVNIHGRMQRCRCGKCDNCRQSYRNNTAFLLSSEMSNWKYNIFFTLTYKPEFVPCVRPFVDDYGHIQLEPIGRSSSLFPYIPYRPFCTPRLPYYHSSSYSWDDHYELSNNLPYLHNAQVPHTIGVLSYRDLSLFKKRFIKNLKSYVKKKYSLSSTKELKYSLFSVGEYGTKFFRPHFHLVFSFDDERLCEDLNKFRDIVYDSWSIKQRLSGGRNRYSVQHFADYSRFSTELETQDRPNFSFCNSFSSVCSYISSYVTSYSHLPYILTLRPWRSKTVSPHGKYGSFGLTPTVFKESFNKIKSAAYGETFSLPIGEYYKYLQSSYSVSKGSFVSSSFRYPKCCIRRYFFKPSQYCSLSHSYFSHLLSYFYAKVLDCVPKNQSLSSFVYSRSFKRVMLSSLSPLVNLRTKRDDFGVRVFSHRLYSDNLIYQNIGLSDSATWLFLRNAVRCIVSEHLSVSEYLHLFFYVHDVLIPQCRLYDFYYEQQLFLSNGISLPSLIYFYDSWPSPNGFRSWYSSLGINLPILDNRLSYKLAGNYFRRIPHTFLDSIHLRFDSINYTNFKHKSRSDF